MNDGILLDMVSGPLPWPSDALIITAAVAGEENRAAMETLVPATCRRCSVLLHVDGRTIRVAEHLPARKGRPVEFFCVACATLHQIPKAVIDQREGR